ncbi:MAG: type IV pilin [Methanoregula sp.]|jgi:FlaG/FlaF family flagellin (archaellin)
MNSYNDDAISPVVGVMLMLVVTIIIAAVVTGFSGKLVGEGSQNAPTLTMDVKVVNSGSWSGSGFFATVTSVSETIPTNDLKIVTAWTATNRTSNLLVSGGSSVQPNGTSNINVLFDPANSANGVAPFGNGPGVGNGTETVSGTDTRRDFSGLDQQFGNYSLMAGTTMTAVPCGAADADSLGGSNSANDGYGVDGRFAYSSGSQELVDPATEVLGSNWELLRIGDTVNVKVIHVPSGKVIFNQDIIVKEG